MYFLYNIILHIINPYYHNNLIIYIVLCSYLFNFDISLFAPLVIASYLITLYILLITYNYAVENIIINYFTYNKIYYDKQDIKYIATQYNNLFYTLRFIYIAINSYIIYIIIKKIRKNKENKENETKYYFANKIYLFIALLIISLMYIYAIKYNIYSQYVMYYVIILGITIYLLK